MHVNRATEIAYALDQITLREVVSQRKESDTVHRYTWLISLHNYAGRFKKYYQSVSNRRLTFLESIKQKLYLARLVISII